MQDVKTTWKTPHAEEVIFIASKGRLININRPPIDTGNFPPTEFHSSAAAVEAARIWCKEYGQSCTIVSMVAEVYHLGRR